MEYFSESARALVARAIALSGGGELLPEHLRLASDSDAVAETSLGCGDTFFGERVLELFAEAYQQARLQGSSLLEESHLRQVLMAEPPGRADLTVADVLDGSVERELSAEGLEVEAIRRVAASVSFEHALQLAQGDPALSELNVAPFYALVAALASDPGEGAAFAAVGMTPELCRRMLRTRDPVPLGIAAKLIRQLETPFQAGESGRAALFVGWMLSKRREVGLERLLQGTLAADLLLNRSGGAADRVRSVGSGEVLRRLPTMVGLHAEGESFPLQMSTEAEAVVRRCRAGFESEDLLTELLSEDCWETLGPEFVALRDRLR